MSRKFSAEVDTQREYYNCQYFNTSGTNQNARYEVQLLKPFFNDPDAWKLSINRASVPLSMPLTHNNIPFQQWQVGIQFNDGTNPPTNNIQYVQQYNAAQKDLNLDKYVSVGLTAGGYTLYAPNNNFNYIGTNFSPSQGSAINGNTFDWFAGDKDNQFIYISNSNGTNYKIVDAITGQQYFIYTEAPGYSSLCICADRTTGDAYVLESNGAQAYVRKATRSGKTWTDAGQVYNFSQANLADASCCIVCVNSDVYLSTYPITGAPAGTDLTISKYVSGNPNPSNQYNLAIVSQASDTFPNMITDGADIYIFYSGTVNAKVNKYDTSFNVLVSVDAAPLIGPLNFANNQFLVGFTNSGNLIFSHAISNNTSGFRILNSSLVEIASSTDPTPSTYGASIIFPEAPDLEYYDVGPYDIYTIQGYLNQINAAYALAFNTLKTQLGSAFLPTEPPSVVFQASTKLFELVVEGQYTTVNNDGTNQYAVFMNQSLWNKFSFPSTVLSIGGTIYESMILQNYGSNAIQENVATDSFDNNKYHTSIYFKYSKPIYYICF